MVFVNGRGSGLRGAWFGALFGAVVGLAVGARTGSPFGALIGSGIGAVVGVIIGSAVGSATSRTGRGKVTTPDGPAAEMGATPSAPARAGVRPGSTVRRAR